MLRAPHRIPLSAHTTVSFSVYRKKETLILEKLMQGGSTRDVLGVRERLFDRGQSAWREAASALAAQAAIPTRSGAALAWFALGMSSVLGEPPAASPRRPWREPYDLAEGRATPSRAEPILGDFLADQVWSLAWLAAGGFDRSCAVVDAQAAIASAVARRLIEEGARPDRAAAEAVMIVELGSATDSWQLALSSAWSTRVSRGHVAGAR